MLRITQEDNSLYTQEELSLCGADGREKSFCICVNHDRGVRLCVEDLKWLFDDEFSEWLQRYHEENEPEYVYEDVPDPDFEIVTVFHAIDMVYSGKKSDKGLLSDLIDTVEARLVRIW